jgi:hypothetical protein
MNDFFLSVQLFEYYLTFAVNAVRNLKPAVDIEPFPKAILATFSAQIRGDDCPKVTSIADLSRVEQSLVNSLMSFQREGVK